MARLTNPIKTNNDLKKVNQHNKIVELIRERYNPNEECAILRKKLAGLDNGEFEKYNAYVEECKARVKGGK